MLCAASPLCPPQGDGQCHFTTRELGQRGSPPPRFQAMPLSRERRSASSRPLALSFWGRGRRGSPPSSFSSREGLTGRFSSEDSPWGCSGRAGLTGLRTGQVRWGRPCLLPQAAGAPPQPTPCPRWPSGAPVLTVPAPAWKLPQAEVSGTF